MKRDLLDAHVALRLRALSTHAAFVPSGAATASVRAHLEALHEHGSVSALEHAESVRGVFAWRHEEDPWFGSMS